MLKYLSDAWMDAAAEAVAADASLAAAAADLDLAVDYEVTGSPFGRRRYQMRFDHGSVAPAISSGTKTLLGPSMVIAL